MCKLKKYIQIGILIGWITFMLSRFMHEMCNRFHGEKSTGVRLSTLINWTKNYVLICCLETSWDAACRLIYWRRGQSFILMASSCCILFLPLSHCTSVKRSINFNHIFILKIGQNSASELLQGVGKYLSLNKCIFQLLKPQVKKKNVAENASSVRWF